MEPKPKPLFDKPMDELREAFVRARFAQEDVFGNPDIEAWLDERRRRSSPYHDSDHEHDERWLSRLLGRAMMDLDPDPLLSQGATAHDASMLNDRLSGPFLHTKHHFRPLLTGLTTLRGREGHTVAVYCGHKLGAIVAVSDDRGEPRSFVVREAPGRTPDNPPSGSLIIDPLTSSAQAIEYVVDVLYAEWMDQLPKWRKARKFLCDAITEAIKRERAKAEADFDTAVAVSADGTKIVHADWVVVVPKSLPHPRSQHWVPRDTMTVFSGTAFRERKILTSAEKMRLGPHYDPYSAQVVSAEDVGRAAAKQFDIVMRSPEESQAFGYLDKGGAGRRGFRDSCLITTADFCPDPFPEGGVEVTV